MYIFLLFKEQNCKLLSIIYFSNFIILQHIIYAGHKYKKEFMK